MAALIVDGLPRSNPFDPLGGPSPGALVKLAVADKVKLIRQLLGAIGRNRHLRAAAQQVEQLDNAVRAVEQGMARIEKLRAALQDARHARDAAATTWANELAALKRAARAAADNGAPTLYGTLFERPSKPSTKSAKAKPAATIGTGYQTGTGYRAGGATGAIRILSGARGTGSERGGRGGPPRARREPAILALSVSITTAPPVV